MPTQRQDHPVWEVYDALRTARLTTRYFAAKVEATRRRNRALEILVAVTVPSSAVAGLPAWNSGAGRYAWAALAGLGSLGAVSKPVLKLTESVEAYEAVTARYRTVEGGLQALHDDIARTRRYDEALQARMNSLAAAMRDAAEIEPIEPFDEALRRRIYEQVIRELPSDHFFVPEEE